MSSRRLFITGTNTEVGKTFVTCEMLKNLVKSKKTSAAFKPIETGCNKSDGVLQPTDSKRFYEILGKSLSHIDLYHLFHQIEQSDSQRRKLHLMTIAKN